MSVVAARDGYRLWAPSYDSETAISHLENLIVNELGVVTACRDLLDVGCGTGRRIRESDANLAVGADVTFAMLADASREQPLSVADVRALPFGRESFDVVWCRLMIGHLPILEIVYAELSRACRSSGAIVVSDVCPEAIAAGHRRTFRDSTGIEHELEHHVHTLAAHTRAAHAAGLELIALRDGDVGEPIREFYERAGRVKAYDQQLGLPLVRVFSWRKRGPVVT
jgi:malonyl-CoA O-methyltransferase